MTALDTLIASLRWNTNMDEAPYGKDLLVRYNRGKSFRIAFKYDDGTWANIKSSSTVCGWRPIPTDTAADVMQVLMKALNEVRLSDECHEAWFHAIALQALQEAERIAGGES